MRGLQYYVRGVGYSAIGYSKEANQDASNAVNDLETAIKLDPTLSDNLKPRIAEWKAHTGYKN